MSKACRLIDRAEDLSECINTFERYQRFITLFTLMILMDLLEQQVMYPEQNLEKILAIANTIANVNTSI